MAAIQRTSLASEYTTVLCRIPTTAEHALSTSSEFHIQHRYDGLMIIARKNHKRWVKFPVRHITGKAVLRLGPSELGPASKENRLKANSSRLTDLSGRPMLSVQQKVNDVVTKQALMLHEGQRKGMVLQDGSSAVRSAELLDEAYDRCGEVCAEYAKTFNLGTKLMTPERRRAIWAIYVWCRRTDELVDGPNASRITPTALDRWEERLEDIFRGHPYDMLDAALADTVARFPVDIQPFRDMIDGMRMDLVKSRYNTFNDLYLYCYNVAGTVGLMSVPIMGIAQDSKATIQSVYSAGLALGIANQLTNILRDVGEDARRNRVYLPQDELKQFGLSDEDVFAGKVTEKWRAFMKYELRRARNFFDEAEKGVMELDKDSRWPVWASLILYRQILDTIEANEYNNFTKRAFVSKAKRLLLLPGAYGKAIVAPPSIRQVLATANSKV